MEEDWEAWKKILKEGKKSAKPVEVLEKVTQAFNCETCDNTGWNKNRPLKSRKWYHPCMDCSAGKRVYNQTLSVTEIAENPELWPIPGGPGPDDLERALDSGGLRRWISKTEGWGKCARQGKTQRTEKDWKVAFAVRGMVIWAEKRTWEADRKRFRMTPALWVPPKPKKPQKEYKDPDPDLGDFEDGPEDGEDF